MEASSSSGRARVAGALLLLLFLLGVAAETNTAVDPNQKQVLGSPAPSSTMNSIDCGSACAARCALASRQNLCERACGSCCARCSCVPPGTSGNRDDECPCYADATTHGGRPKCP